MKYLSKIKPKNKLALLRTDINSDVINGKIKDNPRIKASIVTIDFLKKGKNKIVILAHQGNSGKSDFISLKQHAKIISKYTKVSFKKNLNEKEIKNINPGEAILLENIRFNKDEFSSSDKDNTILDFAKNFDLFINDAFSVSHRNQTSVTGIPKIIPACIGISLERELKALEKISLKDTLYILGGAKPESNIKLLNGKNKVLASGFLGQMSWISKGKDLGYQNNFLKKEALVSENYQEFLKKLFKKQKNVWLPVDFAVEENKKRVEYSIHDFPREQEIKDIGQETINRYKVLISKAKSIYMKGPCGKSDEKNFSKGTLEILKAIKESKAFSVLGGGHLTETMAKYKISEKGFGHVSLSGGALLSFIAGEKLPGLEVLGYYKR